MTAGYFSLRPQPLEYEWMQNMPKCSLFTGLGPQSIGLTAPSSLTFAFFTAPLTAFPPILNSPLSLCNPSGYWLCGLPWELSKAGKIV